MNSMPENIMKTVYFHFSNLRSESCMLLFNKVENACKSWPRKPHRVSTL